MIQISIFLCSVNASFYRWNATGITVAGITGSAGVRPQQLRNPFGLLVDQSNNLYIADRGNHRIQKWIKDASNGTTVAGQSNGVSGNGLNSFNHPANVELDANGTIYITEVFNHRVVYWSNGSFSGILVAGTGETLLNQSVDFDKLHEFELIR